MRRILIVGASILQLPAIIKAKRMGFYVGVADFNSKAIGVPYADEYFNVSTNDVEGMVQTAQKFKPDGIVTLATDMPVRAVAKVCETCGLPGISFDTALKTTDKGKMIKAFEDHGVEHPWYFIVDSYGAFENIVDKITYPCIMKPVDNAGSRGVVKCSGLEELKAGYHYSKRESHNGTVIIEEYLQGLEFSIEAIVIAGEPYVLQITDKITTGAPHFVEMGHSQPTRQLEEQREKLIDLAYRAVKAVGINCGPAHIEMILTEDGPKMVELGARMGGDCIATHLVPLSTGIDMVKATIDIACGNEPDLTPKFERGAAIRYFHTSTGVLKSIAGVDEARRIAGIQEISFVKKIGEKIGTIDSSVDRIGFVIAQSNDVETAISQCKDAMRRVRIDIERAVD